MMSHIHKSLYYGLASVLLVVSITTFLYQNYVYISLEDVFYRRSENLEDSIESDVFFEGDREDYEAVLIALAGFDLLNEDQEVLVNYDHALITLAQARQLVSEDHLLYPDRKWSLDKGNDNVLYLEVKDDSG